MSPAGRRLRVLIAGTWDDGPGYPRTRALRAALEHLPLRVALCHEPPPTAGQSKQRLVRSPWRWPAHWLATRRARRNLQSTLTLALHEFQPDVVFVPYPGHAAVHWIRERFTGRIVLDLFLSAHDTIVEDRQLLRPGSFGARYLARLDRTACAAADLVLMDTPQSVARAVQQTGLPPAHFDWIPIGDPEAPTHVEVRESVSATEGGSELEMIYLGTGVPLHGLSHLLDAFDASWRPGNLACPRAWRLTLIGGDRRSRRRAASLSKVELGPQFVAAATWSEALRNCDAVAGIYGRSAKADRVVPFKVVHGLAAGRVVVTAETAAVRERLSENECVTVPPGDGLAIRSALNALAADVHWRGRVERRARAAYDREFSSAAIAEHWRRVLRLPAAASAPPAPVDEPMRLAGEASAAGQSR